MINLTVELGLMAKCLVRTHPQETFENALVLCATSQIFHKIINSDAFFKALVYALDPKHPFLYSKQDPAEASLKHKFLDLRHYFSYKIETLNGAYGVSCISEVGIKLISFNDELQNNLTVISSSSCTILRLGSRASFCEFHTDQYSAINREDSIVEIYKRGKEDCLKRYQFEGEICQITIQNSQLYVIEHEDEVCYLNYYNLECLPENPFSIVLPGEYLKNVCFGKDHLIYIKSFADQDDAYALPYSYLLEQRGEDPWIKASEKKEGFLYFFPEGSNFIEVHFHERHFIVSRIYIEADLFIRTPITEKIAIPYGQQLIIGYVHFHNNRLFFSNEIPGQDTKIFFYDMELGKMGKIIPIPEHDGGEFFLPLFLSAAEKVYYLCMKLDLSDSEVKSQLTTLKFGKI
jgi:hypothetical protein